jgi:hypothetical protein
LNQQLRQKIPPPGKPKSPRGYGVATNKLLRAAPEARWRVFPSRPLAAKTHQRAPLGLSAYLGRGGRLLARSADRLVVEHGCRQLVLDYDPNEGRHEVIDGHVAQCGLTAEAYEHIMPQTDLNRMRSQIRSGLGTGHGRQSAPRGAMVKARAREISHCAVAAHDRPPAPGGRGRKIRDDEDSERGLYGRAVEESSVEGSSEEWSGGGDRRR